MPNLTDNQPDKALPPSREEPAKSWQHYELWKRILNLFESLPREFASTITVSGIAATEVYTFGAVLGATIEEEVVRTLNNLRQEWDPEDKYGEYLFVRQPQTFPDVVLKIPNSDPILGIELKSWYLLAKEGEPSLRFLVSETACASQDLFVVVPWALSNVLSGNPIVFEPFVETAIFVAKYRNYWWQHIRETSSDSTISQPKNLTPYPSAKTEINDVPLSDSGHNFGRVGRIKLEEFDSWVVRFKTLSLLGIRISAWRKFFKEHID